ncbi:hypothetical protein AKO1_009581 [Acrasis kona]|uniref:ATP synthase mitochondrial F1 complex assembly factor 1 n=1 Tax=Acrasis kona TaxID=1008807 RepID=A0AAW2YP94_9EUKA
MLLNRRSTLIRAFTPLARSFKNFQSPGPKSLDSIVNIRKFEKEEPHAIEEIWNNYHLAVIDVVSRVVPIDKYKLLLHRTKESPMFVLPIFKNIGYANMVVQAQRDHILFTSMREYKEKESLAAPYVSLSHFTDLAQSKGIVLVRAEVNTDQVNKGEALELIKNMYDFYLMDDLYRDFVQVFNLQPHMFSFDRLMEAVMKLRPPVAKQTKQDPRGKIDLKKQTTTPITQSPHLIKKN